MRSTRTFTMRARFMAMARFVMAIILAEHSSRNLIVLMNVSR